jgi:peroxiredoxin
MKRLTVALVAVLATSAFAGDELAAVNQPAPAFRLPVYNAKAAGVPMIGIDKYVGYDATDKETKVVLLSFMASFCAPCKKEMPYLQSLHEKYKDFGLRVVMVSIDSEPEGQKIIEQLIEKNKITFPVLKDRFNLVARRWLGAQSPLPSVFMIKPDGTVASVHRGYNEEASKLLAKEVEHGLGIKRGQGPATANLSKD